MADIVANKSKAYGYNYASLGDIASQGFPIPKMKTGSEDGKEYVYYYDAELKEWTRGAEIVIPQMKSMNEAQRYGSALTYARRYTTLMALSLACDDDKALETTEERKASEKQIEMIVRLYDSENITKMLKYYKAGRLEDLTVSQASQAIDRKKAA